MEKFCRNTKKIEEFEKRKDSISGFGHRCKICSNKYKLNFRNRNLEKVRKQARDSAKRKYPTTGKNRDLLRNYGITLEQYNIILKSQDGKCKTCSSTEKLRLDHDHSNGKVRGILCDDCNLSIGRIKENIQTLKNMIIYLEDNKN